jgi:hypothetical protein
LIRKFLVALQAKEKGIARVVVSDGFNVVQTDSDGNYAIDVNPLAKFIWLSTPSGL